MRVGLVGAGLQGRRRVQALQEAGGDQLVIVADVDGGAARALASESGCIATTRWAEVVAQEGVEAVMVATPPHLHHSITLAALEKGKHVLCEKPLARTVPEAEEMVAAARRTGAVLKCGFNLRHHPGLQQAHAWAAEGAIGPLMYLRARYGIGGRPGYEKDWRARAEISGGGQLMDQGMHLIDLGRWFLGEFTEGYAQMSTYFWDIKVEDNAFCLLRTSGGQTAMLHASWTEWKNLFSLELFGRDGYVVVEGLGGSYGTEHVRLGKRAFLEPFQEHVIEYRGPDRSWEEEWKEFVAAISQGRQPLGSGEDGLKALRLAHGLYESSRQKRAIAL